jgi:hypothetical protein
MLKNDLDTNKEGSLRCHTCNDLLLCAFMSDARVHELSNDTGLSSRFGVEIRHQMSAAGDAGTEHLRDYPGHIIYIHNTAIYEVSIIGIKDESHPRHHKTIQTVAVSLKLSEGILQAA